MSISHFYIMYLLFLVLQSLHNPQYNCSILVSVPCCYVGLTNTLEKWISEHCHKILALFLDIVEANQEMIKYGNQSQEIMGNEETNPKAQSAILKGIIRYFHIF